MRGSYLPHAKFSLQLVKFLLRYAMRIMFGMFSFEFWVFGTQNCEVVLFTKFKSACVHARPLKFLDVLVLYRAHASCTCVCITHARHVVTRFAYIANHVIMTSLVFTFHLCHIGMRWHDVIGVCIA